MSKLRVSVVEFLNTAPLVWGFTDGPLAGKYDLSFTVPSQCAEALKRGDADVAIIPSVEYQRIAGVVALPGMAIAAKQEVRSLLVVAKRPIHRVKRLALDTSSRSTAALVRILCKEHWQIAPEFVGHTLMIHNGKHFISVLIVEGMVGHRLGEFSPTRTFRGHGKVVAREISKT